ncbi:uncharacterized protein KY384_001628 [Bacidia gigantensis]|uniref:uncharacterized protein n=1 Tax=Bacidia gigantensis TaxID=2732470 RepID=UPI001D0379F5|nr:uncharacterized protein KY384_001628 [Bacidia gigantensis]KAG8533887.1 hypothetical protein KY384_001628 [Bacidia gigantensis]
MLNGKVYVVTSIDLINAVNRNSKVLSFNPFIAQLGKRITGHDEATSRIVQHNLNGENGSGYVIDIHDASVTSLAPGKSLENMTATMLTEASVHFAKLKPDDEIGLFAWIKHMVTMCSTRAIYGPENPFNQDEWQTVRQFWEFDQNLNTLIVDIAPQVFARKGYRARSELGLAFEKYFNQYDPKRSRSATLIETRHSINTHYGVDPQNSGRLEVGVLLGILANTIPSIFYMLIHILADPTLLRDIREEIETTSLRQDEGSKTICLKVTTMREKCTLLHSTFQEMLRLHALGTSSRYVREDILLQDQYLLKKDMVVQIPMAVMHSDPEIWGADVMEFQPRRFFKLPNSAKEYKTNATAYRPFGGGASLCPGRHFVTLEAMALVACFVMRYDVVPVEGGGVG